MATSVRISAGNFTVEIETDAEIHPDLLDECCARAKAIFLEVQLGLSETDSEGDDAAT